MSPQQLADARVHEILAELIELVGVEAIGQAVAVARNETARKQAVLFLTDYEPLRIAGPIQLPPLSAQPEPPPKLREVEQCALEAAPRPTAAPITIKQLARIAGYAYNSHFREAVRRLMELRLIVRIPGGVRKV